MSVSTSLQRVGASEARDGVVTFTWCEAFGLFGGWWLVGQLRWSLSGGLVDMLYIVCLDTLLVIRDLIASSTCPLNPVMTYDVFLSAFLATSRFLYSSARSPPSLFLDRFVAHCVLVVFIRELK